MTPEISLSNGYCAPIPELAQDQPLSQLATKHVIGAVRQHLAEAFGAECVKVNRRATFANDMWRGAWWMNGGEPLSYLIFLRK